LPTPSARLTLSLPDALPIWIHAFAEPATGKEHVALTLGAPFDDAPVLARIHSECLTGDALFSQRCDCGAQLEAALQRIAEEGRRSEEHTSELQSRENIVCRL